MPKWRVIRSRVGTRRSLLGLALFFFISNLLLIHGAAAPGIQNIDPKNPQLAAMFSKPANKSKPTTSGKKAVTPLSTPAQSGAELLNLVKPRATSPKHAGLAASSSPILRKIAEYEQVYGGSPQSRVMLFTDIPSGPGNAPAAANEMAQTLQEFAHYGIAPLIIMEPTINGDAVDFQAYSQGAYDTTLDAYFQALQAKGLTSSTVGMWTYFPEANHPEWGATNPSVFANNVTRSVNIQKKYFPGSWASIMLDSQSYPAGSTDWGNGSYVSLQPYLQGIPKGLIDSFGYQGFPWAPAANVKQATSYNPAQYLNSTIAADAARLLGTSKIWLNTGTFGRMYTQNAGQTVNMDPLQRQAILTGVAAQSKALQSGGFSVSVNLFSENKSDSGEGTDWSYWNSGAAVSSPATPVFIDFANQLIDNHVELWLYDSY